MSLSLADLQTYLATTGGFSNVQLNRLQDAPDEAIAVQVAGGSTPIMDGAFESTHVHVRIRSTTDIEAETLALAFHAFMSSHEVSFQMGSTYVLSLTPDSGPPQYFDRDVTNRTTYMGSYEIAVAV
jgi:hypothetical protein